MCDFRNLGFGTNWVFLICWCFCYYSWWDMVSCVYESSLCLLIWTISKFACFSILRVSSFIVALSFCVHIIFSVKTQSVIIHVMWCIFHSSDECLLILVFLDKLLSHLFRNHCMFAITLCLIVALSSTQQVSIFGKSVWIKKRTVTQFRNSCTRIFFEITPFFRKHQYWWTSFRKLI